MGERPLGNGSGKGGVDVALDERFTRSDLDPRLGWLNPPARWRVEPVPGRLVVEPDGETDFWRRTHYGFSADNGHFLFVEVSGDFTALTHVAFQPANQYDQAGLMVRVSGDCWLKTSVEYESEGPSRLGAVVTNGGFSDWSVQDFPHHAGEVWLRVTRRGCDMEIEFRPTAGVPWKLMRIAHLDVPGRDTLQCGLYACSPKGAGFRAAFHRFLIAGIST
jgi:uncharacterized protein